MKVFKNNMSVYTMFREIKSINLLSESIVMI